MFMALGTLEEFEGDLWDACDVYEAISGLSYSD